MNRTDELRALIRKHKRWDMIFGVVGLLALSVGTGPRTLQRGAGRAGR